MRWMTIRRHGWTHGWLSLTSVLLGCTLGSKSLGEDGGDDGSGSAEGTASGETGSEGTSGTGESGALACEGYDSPNTDPGPRVEVLVRSETTAPVYFGTSGCSNTPVLEVIGPGGEPLAVRLGTLCDEFIGGTECNVGGEDCGTPNGGRLEPAATADAGWPGWTLTEVEVDPACAPEPNCPSTCQLMDQAPPGTYEIALTVFRSCTGTCECDGPTPVCGLFGANELGDPVTFTAIVDYPAQTSVEIVITDG
jgi:hypothetical protein